MMLIEASFIGIARTILSVYSILWFIFIINELLWFHSHNIDYCSLQRMNLPLLFNTHYHAIQIS